MSISRFFEQLGAPLANQRWSWGAISSDGVVFLRVWQDATQLIDGKRFVQVSYPRDGGNKNPGIAEREIHLRMIKEGADAFAIFVRARDPQARPRDIASFNDKSVFKLSHLRDVGGELWAELGEPVPSRALKVRD